MRFYSRESELKVMNDIYIQSSHGSRMTVITGRRRIGKTQLSLKHADGHQHLYLFVSKKSETLLCKEFLEQIQQKFELPTIGEIKSMVQIFALLFKLSESERVTVIIDEFQEFQKINHSVYSELQHLWDRNKNTHRLNLILIGSVYSLMTRIFQHSKEPLFGRADRILYLNPFQIETLDEILSDHSQNNLELIFDYYLVTGGIPRYVEILVDNALFTRDAILDFILDKNSPFLFEGRNVLIGEFGRDYTVYFSILELISTGHTSRPEIESIIEKNTGGYLDRLEREYNIISRVKPIHAKPNSRLQRYCISDNFLQFWFRFIYRNRSAIEANNFEFIKSIIRRDYSTYSGKILEKFCVDLLKTLKKYNRIGSYWEKGNQNEIDIVALDDVRKEILICEVKMNKSKISVKKLKEKSLKLVTRYPAYTPIYEGMSLADAGNMLKGR